MLYGGLPKQSWQFITSVIKCDLATAIGAEWLLTERRRQYQTLAATVWLVDAENALQRGTCGSTLRPYRPPKAQELPKGCPCLCIYISIPPRLALPCRLNSSSLPMCKLTRRSVSSPSETKENLQLSTHLTFRIDLLECATIPFPACPLTAGGSALGTRWLQTMGFLAASRNGGLLIMQRLRRNRSVSTTSRRSYTCGLRQNDMTIPDRCS